MLYQLIRNGARVLSFSPWRQTLSPWTPLCVHFSDDATNRDLNSPPRLFVVQPRLPPGTVLQAKLDEALALASSLEEQRDDCIGNKAIPPSVIVQNPLLGSSRARAATFFGPGTVDAIKCHLFGLENKDKVDGVFVNAILTGVQQRNLERIWEKPVLDRVGLIIDIFHAHAHTREAKLQAELAALTYKKSRLVRVRGPGGRFTFGGAGEAEVVSARGRGSVGRGFISGAGETELQLQRRRILDRRSALLIQIEEVRRTRAQQRAARRRHGGLSNEKLATVAIVGYTNAGKSTLMNALTSSTLYSDSRLFATLDPRIKSYVLPSGRKVLFSDTVGFISDLPVQLVEAFHATLEEVVEADLLVHVIDSTAPNLEEHRHSVLQVLRQIGVSNEKLQDMIEVWNKIDCEKIDPCKASYDQQYNNDTIISENEDDNELNSITETNQEDESGFSDKEDNFGQCQIVAEKSTIDFDSEPRCKVSAVTGEGLQLLVQLVDEKLKLQDEKFTSQNHVQNSIFDRKWRPKVTVASH